MAALTLVECAPENFRGCVIVFSALDSSVAGPIEEAFAAAGIAVFSNARNHRQDPDVPLLVPHANADHLRAVVHQQRLRKFPKGGFLVTNANCTTTGLIVPLKALHDRFGLERVFVVSMQAVSGAGYPGVPSLDITDNVVPYISGEEEKVQKEPLKILGHFDEATGSFAFEKIGISAHCNRVPVIDGHTECVSVKFKTPGVTPEECVKVRQGVS